MRIDLAARWARLALLAGALAASASHAGSVTEQQRCLSSLARATGSYASCAGRVFSSVQLAAPAEGIEDEGLAKCLLKYVAAFDKVDDLVNSSCGSSRFSTSPLTVYDLLTGLEWEQKGDAGGDHDVDNLYTWSQADADPDTSLETLPTGTVFTGFLTVTNEACYAGRCDWRLPTLAELRTIMLAQPDPCDAEGVNAEEACIMPPFTNVATDDCYWAQTSVASNLTEAYVQCFGTAPGDPEGVETRLKTGEAHVRAVRGP